MRTEFKCHPPGWWALSGCAALARIPRSLGAVVVKRCKPQQDLRFDLPAVGPRTIEVMESVKAYVLALEAGRGILLDRDDTIAKANRAGIAIVGDDMKPIAMDREAGLVERQRAR